MGGKRRGTDVWVVLLRQRSHPFFHAVLNESRAERCKLKIVRLVQAQ
jgi:hypothetical protein